MKFKNEADKKLYEALELNDSIIRNKLSVIAQQIKNRKKSMQQKTFWRRNAYKMKRAIQKWHQSVAGKRFHRNLGNFLATHLTRNDLGLNIKKEELNINDTITNVSIDDCVQILLGLNNIKTHLILELQYFEKDSEALEEFFEIFFEYLNDAYDIELKVLQAYITGQLDVQTLLKIIDIFVFFIDEEQFVYEVRHINGKSNDINNDKVFEELENDFEIIDQPNKSKLEKFIEYLDKYKEN